MYTITYVIQSNVRLKYYDNAEGIMSIHYYKLYILAVYTQRCLRVVPIYNSYMYNVTNFYANETIHNYSLTHVVKCM